MQTTVGQILVNNALPEHLRDYSRILDKDGVKKLLEQLATEGDHDAYRDTVAALHKAGIESAQSSGSSFSIADLRTPPKTKLMISQLRQKVNEITESHELTDEQKEKAVTHITMKATPVIESTMMDELQAAGNPFADQVKSGSRGGKGDLRSMIAGDMLVTDHRDRVIPLPITKGYASGADPVEYWAASYGARKGTLSTKLNVQRAGFLGKQLVQAAHKQVITEKDCGTTRGIPVASDDSDNVGAVLSEDVGEYKAGTPITPRIQSDIADKFKGKQINVRSALTCEATNGLCSRCAGIRERGTFPEIGDNIGVAVAQALAERLSQSSLGQKHAGGRAQGHELSNQPIGFKLINQLVQVPKSFTGGAAIAKLDGVVREIKDAPQGGKHIVVGDQDHYVPAGLDINVKPGMRVEEGDLLSEGLPNPADLVEHKGLGAGRLDFVNIFRDAYRKSKLSANRRNIEVMTRGLINHVKVLESDGVDNAVPDDMVEYSSIERNYRPRYGFKVVRPAMAVGHYLERPVRQYTIGTRVTHRVADDLTKNNTGDITVHRDPPPFAPRMVRAMEQSSIAPDWQTRMGGSYLERGLLDALHEGVPSEIHSTSYIPALARGKGFGDELTSTGKY